MSSLPPLPPPLPTQEAPREPLFPAWHFLRRNRHVTVPLIAVPGGFAWAGEALAHMPNAFGPAAGAAAAGAVATWLYAPHKWTGQDGKPRWPEVWYARLSAAAAGSWLAIAAKYGVHAPEAITLGAGSLAWGIPWWWHKRPHSRKRASLVQTWDLWWCHYAPGWNLHGSTVRDVTTEGVMDTLHVQLSPGKQALKNVREALPLIESALQGHVEEGKTRVELARGDNGRTIPSRVLVHLKRENPLDGDVEWDDSAAPASVTELMPIGCDESGEWVFAPMLTNWFLIGKTRSGKSNELNAFLASITGCPDAAKPWIIDRKGGRSARPWLEGAGWVATDTDEARLLLRTAEAEVKARSLGAYDGNEQLIPTVDCPALFIVVDEANGVLSTMRGDPECRKLAGTIASEGSAVNVHLIVLTQYGALDESVGTEQIRGNLTYRMCFAVARAEHGQFALSDWAHLDASRLENQGEFYWQDGPKSPSSPGRGQRMDHDFVREIVARSAAKPDLVLYASEFQEALDTWRDRLPEQLHPDYVPPQRQRGSVSVPARSSPQPEVPVNPYESIPDMVARIEDEVAALPDVPAPPVIDPALLADRMTRQKARFADLLAAAPPGGIKPSQLATGSGMSTSWIHLTLRPLADRGVITQLTRGRYGPVAGQDIWTAMQVIEAERSALADEARDQDTA